MAHRTRARIEHWCQAPFSIAILPPVARFTVTHIADPGIDLFATAKRDRVLICLLAFLYCCWPTIIMKWSSGSVLSPMKTITPPPLRPHSKASISAPIAVFSPNSLAGLFPRTVNPDEPPYLSSDGMVESPPRGIGLGLET